MRAPPPASADRKPKMIFHRGIVRDQSRGEAGPGRAVDVDRRQGLAHLGDAGFEGEAAAGVGEGGLGGRLPGGL